MFRPLCIAVMNLATWRDRARSWSFSVKMARRVPSGRRWSTSDRTFGGLLIHGSKFVVSSTRSPPGRRCRRKVRRPRRTSVGEARQLKAVPRHRSASKAPPTRRLRMSATATFARRPASRRFRRDARIISAERSRPTTEYPRATRPRSIEKVPQATSRIRRTGPRRRNSRWRAAAAFGVRRGSIAAANVSYWSAKTRNQRPWALSDSLPKNRTRDDDPVDLPKPRVGFRDMPVAAWPLDRIVHVEPVPGVDLDRVVHGRKPRRERTHVRLLPLEA